MPTGGNNTFRPWQGSPPHKIQIRDVQRKSELPAEILEGSIAKWMDRRVEDDVVRAKISYETENESVVDREFAVRLHATDASTRVYEQILSAQSAEPTPRGLAKRLYEAVSPLAFEGRVTLESEEINGESLMGSALNISGGPKEWLRMNGVIQQIKEDPNKGILQLTFGPPKHLGADDLVELLRLNRRRRASRSAGRRAHGRAIGTGLVEQPTHGRIENSTTGSGGYQKMVFTHPKNPQARVIVDAGAIPEQETVVTLREERVCENGSLKARLVLASEPYDPTSTRKI